MPEPMVEMRKVLVVLLVSAAVVSGQELPDQPQTWQSRRGERRIREQTATPQDRQTRRAARRDSETRPPQQVQDRAERTERARTLLERVHTIATQLDGDARVRVYSRLARESRVIDRGKAAEWAMELWRSENLSEKQTYNARLGAVDALALIDAEQAIELLKQVDPQPADTTTSPFVMPRTSQSASMVFVELFRRRGAAVLPKLREAALQMGARDLYPYAPMGGLMAFVRQKDSDTAEAMFRESMEFYRTAPRNPASDAGFAALLMQMWPVVARPLATEAASMLTHNLLAFRPDADNQSASKGNPANTQLRTIAGMLSNLDPNLLNRIYEERPELKTGATFGTGVPARAQAWSQIGNGQRATIGAGAAQSQNQRGTSQQQQRASRRRQAGAGQMPTAAQLDDFRRRMQVQAGGFGLVTDPTQLELMSKRINSLEKQESSAKDPESELPITISIARTASMIGNRGKLMEAMQHGFELGAKILRKQTDNPDAKVDTTLVPRALSALVATGVSVDLDSTLGFLNMVESYPEVQANLLLDAIRTLQFDRSRREAPMIVPATQ